MRHFLFILALAASTLSPLPALAGGNAILIPEKVPFERGTRIRAAIKRDCQLEEKLADFIKTYSEEKGLNVVVVNATPKKGDRRDQLKVIINDAIGGGGGMWSGPKSVFVSGSYLVNGKVKATFEGHRSSSGGFMGGYKGTCAILGRCVKALGKDIAAWMVEPDSSVRLGE